jgi:lipoate-protein ligase B
MASIAKLPPVLVHFFKHPLPYTSTWNLQQKIHETQLSLRNSGDHPDILLLLQHRPIYTAGRRQSETAIHDERVRLQNLGADFVSSTRGGQLTYHGPGQIVGYPLIDLSRYTPTMGTKDYVCRIQKLLKYHLHESHNILSSFSEHTGVFLDATTKIASIGVQVRHRLTSHGFAINITAEPLSWFDQIVACGLDDVRAGSIESKLNKPIAVETEIPGIVQQFGTLFEREMKVADLGKEGQIGEAIVALEKEAEEEGDWPKAPVL